MDNTQSSPAQVMTGANVSGAPVALDFSKAQPIDGFPISAPSSAPSGAQVPPGIPQVLNPNGARSTPVTLSPTNLESVHNDLTGLGVSSRVGYKPIALDFSKAQPIDGAAPAATTTAPAAGMVNQNPMAVGNTQVLKGIGEGMAGTGAGIMGISEKLANPSSDPNNERQWFKDTKDWLDQHSHNTGADTSSYLAQGAGQGIEGLGEWLMGDEMLKGASLSERLLTSGKIAKAIESSPRLGILVRAGTQALRGGAIGGTLAGVKSGGDPTATATGAATGAIGNVLIPATINSAKDLPALYNTLKHVIEPDLIRNEFQGGIRGLLNDTAQEAGVNPSASTSIRDVANDVSTSLQAKAQQSYKALDEASGGRVQRFSDSIKAVQQKLRNLNGIASPDDEGAWVEKLNDLQSAHENAMQDAEAAGVPRTLLDQANANYKQAMALSDLSKNIRASSEGLRPDLTAGAMKPRAFPETLNPVKLSPRVNKMYDAGRLQAAIGEDRSNQMLQSVNDAHATRRTVQNITNLAERGLKHAGVTMLTYEFIKHLLGE
jgi:hypothetical protein